MNVKKSLALVLMLALCAVLLTACSGNAAKREEVQTLYAEVKSEFDAMVAKAQTAGEDVKDDINNEITVLGEELKTIEAKVDDSEIKKQADKDLDTMKADLTTIKDKAAGLATRVEDAVKEATAAAGEEAKTLYEDAKAGFDTLKTKVEEAGEHAGADIKDELTKAEDELKALEEKVADSHLVTMARSEIEKLKEDITGVKTKAEDLATRTDEAVKTATAAAAQDVTKLYDEAKEAVDAAKAKVEAAGEDASAEIKEDLTKASDSLKAVEGKISTMAMDELNKAKTDLAAVKTGAEGIVTRTEDAVKAAKDAVVAEAKTVYGEAKDELATVKADLDKAGEKATETMKSDLAKLETELKTLEGKIADSKLATMTKEEVAKAKDDLSALKTKIVTFGDKVKKAM